MSPLTDAEFDSEVLKADRPVLVDFFADWCGPCKEQAEILARFEAEVGDRVRICAVDVEREARTTSLYRVLSVPTLILFRKGDVVGRWTGRTGLETLQKAVTE